MNYCSFRHVSELAMLLTQSESLNKAWCSEEAARIQTTPSTLTISPWHVLHTHCCSIHYGPEMITPGSLSLICLVTRIPHWENPTFSSQKAVFASWNATHLSRFVLNALDSVHPSLTCSADNGFLQQWPWTLCVNDSSLPYLSARPAQMLHKCAAERGEGQNGRKTKTHGRQGMRKKNRCPFHLSTRFEKQN